MATCGACGRPVTWEDVPERGRVAFDLYDVIRGPNRWVRQHDGRLTPVRDDADVMAMQEHAITCGAGTP